MLIDTKTLERLAAGGIDTLFRWWVAPRVKVGTLLRRPQGAFEVLEVEIVSVEDLSARDATAAGFEDLAALLADVQAHAPSAEGKARSLYRIRLKPSGEDPRIALREKEALEEDEFVALEERVARMGARSADGAWGLRLLRLVAEHPARRAADLAQKAEMPTRPFKSRVRQLKELGLTESLEVGYRLSPRGQAFLDRSNTR